MVGAITSARMLHLLSLSGSRASGDAVFLDVLDRYTNASIHMIHSMFSLAELLTHATFHLTSSTIKFSLKSAEDIVHVFDGLFGETETSKALAAFIVLVRHELSDHSNEGSSLMSFNRLTALGQVSKAMTAYCCLQYVNRKRWRNSLKLTSIFEGHAPPSALTDKHASSPRECVPHRESGECSAAGRGNLSMQEAYALLSGVLPGPAPIRSAVKPLARRMSNPEGRPRVMAMTQLTPLKVTPDLPIPAMLDAVTSDAVTGSNAGDGNVRNGCPPAAEPDELQPHKMGGKVSREERNRSCSPRGLDPSQVVSVLKMLESVQLTPESGIPTPNSSSTSKGLNKSRSHSQLQRAASLSRPSTPSIPDNCVKYPRPLQAWNKKPVDPRLKLFEKIERFGRFSSGAYGASFLRLLGLGRAKEMMLEQCDVHFNHQSFSFHTEVPIEHIVTSSHGDLNPLHPPMIHAPVHYVVVDAQTSSVVVSLRGTLGLSDLVTDLTSSYAPFVTSDGERGMVHSGMLASAKKVAHGPVRDAVAEALEKHPGFSLVLTGHSLGGGVAALLALLWSRQIRNEDGSDSFVVTEEAGFRPCPIHCYVYGPPAVMSANLSRYTISLITTVIHRHDIVPCLSLGLIRDFKNVATNLCHEPGLAERIIGKVLGVFRAHEESDSDTSSADELWYWALLKTLRADMAAEKLYPPGTVYWINAIAPSIVASSKSNPQPTIPKQSKKARISIPVTLHRVDDVETAFSEFTFSKTMFMDHSPDSYEKALQSLLTAMRSAN
ncbi:hypothetical protein HK104_009828 [Borealophlyctis nickersoniae]|nr:hypothetical protein HK104_009828 [Borealophlyctis nickersoniae]